MRNLMIFCAVLVAIGSYMAQMADKWTPVPAAANAAQTKAQTGTVVQDGIRSLSIPRDARGHFQTNGRIDGQRVDFMVDTGASMVALRERDANKLGIFPAARDYTGRSSTANGIVKVAPVRLSSLEVNGIRVYDVQAMVLPDEALNVNLLGMSFLSRVRRFEMANGRLVMEQ